MTYQKKLNPEIAGITEDLSNLKPGESLRLGPLTTTGLTSIRWQVYSYLRETGIKPFFIIKVRVPYLIITRKQTEYNVEKLDRKRELPNFLGDILKEALLEDDPPRFLADKYQSGELTAAEFAEALSSYYDTQK